MRKNVCMSALTFGLSGVLFVGGPADAGIDYPHWKYHSSSWRIPTEGAKAKCNSHTGGKIVRGHHHNWGRDHTTVWFNRLNRAYWSTHGPVWAGWVSTSSRRSCRWVAEKEAGCRQ